MNSLEQQVPSLNACLSLLARGITTNTVFCWARDDDGNCLVLSMYGVKPDRHVTPLCAAPRSKELLQALANLGADRFSASWLVLVNEPEALARSLLEAAPIADYECMDLGLLLAIQEAGGMQMMTGARAWSKEEEIALQDAVRHAVAREGNVAYRSSGVEEVAWVIRCIRRDWDTRGGSDFLAELLGLKESKDLLTEAGIRRSATHHASETASRKLRRE